MDLFAVHKIKRTKTMIEKPRDMRLWIARLALYKVTNVN